MPAPQESTAPQTRPTPVLSTYRLQLHGPGPDGVPAFTLADATALLDQLHDLGVSHVYCSPVLTAAEGSQHGYDVVDPTTVSAALGGPEALDALAAAARERGMGVVVDIVPNHVGVAVPAENRWWWDLLTHGRESRYASWFDVDWSADNGAGGRIALPVLGSDDDVADLALRTGGPDGETVLAYYEHEYPVAPGTGDGTPQEVHDRQAYRLVGWRTGLVGYRRFFTVSELAGLRQEDPDVFAATHVEVARWARDGVVDGIRVDHPDGLADPVDYLGRLREVLGPDRWLVVEKILGADELLDPVLPVAGTTGYDALREVGGVLVDPDGEAPLTAWCRERAGDGFDAASLAAAEHDLERGVLRDGLAPEVARLVRAVRAAAPTTLTDDDLSEAVVELLAAVPVYRSDYPSLAGLLPAALARVAAARPALVPALGPVAVALLAGGEAATRFQQVCGAATAKGVEDCLFYRANRLLTLQEVGGDPGRFGVSPAELHVRAAHRAQVWPAAMTTLSTHDTKRGEDVRARIGVLSQVVPRWTAAVDAWEATAPTPDPATGFLLWQTVLGVWPADGTRPGQDVVTRLHAYVEKAIREAGTRTGWNDVDEDFERAVHDWVDAVCTGPLAAEVGALVAELAPHGWSDSLAQKLLQLAGPGVPDVYQGTELWEDSLVDPDNRREVDHAHRRSLLAELDGWAPRVDATGRAKLLVVREALRLRRERPASFVGGAYLPLLAEGDAAAHAVAFARGPRDGEPDVVAVATRLPARLDGWGATTLPLPAGRWTDRLTGAAHEGRVALADLLGVLPVALLERA